MLVLPFLLAALAQEPASFSLAGDWEVRVRVPHGPEQVVRVTPPVMTTVTAEKYDSLPVFNPKAGGWVKGVQLKGVRAQETTSPGLLDTASFRLRRGPEPNAPLLEPGKDYEVDLHWGTLGRVRAEQTDQPVYASYRHAQLRLDAVVLTPSGQIVVKQGQPRAAAPEIPAIAPGERHLGNIYLAGYLTSLNAQCLFPVLENAYPERPVPVTPLISRLTEKLDGGGSLRILAWGDSVTDGRYLAEPSQRWQEQFVARLRQRFPKAKIELLTQAWGGRNTRSYLNEPPGSPHNYQETVLGVKPDVIVSEFVNDASLKPDEVEERYTKLLSDFQGIGADWIILTPHYVRPDWMNLTSEHGVDQDPRPYVAGLRAFTAKHGVTLADASLRYGRLWRQGIPYNTLMLNAINHPNAFGMKLFADALMALFPKRPAVDRIFSSFNTHTPGCAVGVAQAGKTVFTAGYGMADLERDVAITPETVFESGSVAKQFTAATLMLLAQSGKISLDDPMRKYLPELPDYGAPLTIRQVISHVSGLREWRPIAEFGGYPEGTFTYSNTDLLQMATMQKGLNFDSGTNYSYSNIGYNMSPILVERVLGDGRSFPAYTEEMIFRPLGMTHTGWRDDFRRLVPNRALAYGRRENGSWALQTPIENIIGAGGLLTTVGDLLLWNENFEQAKVGGPEFVKAQQTPATLKSGKTIAYAAGLTINQVDGVREVSHSGSTGGYRTWLGRYPEQHLSVAVLCNSAAASTTELGRETARLWLGTTATPPPSPYPIGADQLTRLEGLYRKLRDNTTTEATYRQGKFAFGQTELIPTGPEQFVTRSGTMYQFSGSRLNVTTPNGEVTYERVERWKPAAAELVSYSGSYSSAETNSTVAVKAEGGQLSYQVGVLPSVKLKPAFRDSFSSPNGASVTFVRDPNGRVTGLTVGDDRVWGLRFTRGR